MDHPKKEIVDKIRQLEEKFRSSGQDLSSYLEGLLHADYLNYWDYINLDTLLTLQQPKTSFKDEKIFIIYHQITELYFNLILWELEQMAAVKDIEIGFFKNRLKRVIMYFDLLISSFAVMWKGMEREQFMKFRMSLLPASGFQSAQYRMIEIMCTDIQNLVYLAEREDYKDINLTSIDSLFDILYWQYGAKELATGKKTLTLKSFEQKYGGSLKELIAKFRKNNLWKKYLYLPDKDEELTDLMRELDEKANVYWPLAHYKSAVKYLQKDPMDIAATGGTNWQKFLPPRFQKVIFYPDLWSEEEVNNWGKNWVEKELLGGVK
ncbi:tryptophan 2,3-dioxygenase family protein [Cyclobacterium plantarum]|uniref:Tryptophan 2,3-dioxygenase n=1 Tax=Cyclobacterium plantarum TaxID=2716263 RepID=A0ABX0H4E6_9BACT|nr:tryptophan 2,3-dioxygenase family protein [Cyclobacterium plantarum]NHE56367.1 tryptophan 2,3-dioxygenase [Cyclobacterium plantarum]